MRVWELRLRFRDSPSPLVLAGVISFLTEGGLVRFVSSDGKSVWYPLCNIYAIEELGRVET